MVFTIKQQFYEPAQLHASLQSNDRKKLSPDFLCHIKEEDTIITVSTDWMLLNVGLIEPVFFAADSMSSKSDTF